MLETQLDLKSLNVWRVMHCQDFHVLGDLAIYVMYIYVMYYNDIMYIYIYYNFVYLPYFTFVLCMKYSYAFISMLLYYI